MRNDPIPAQLYELGDRVLRSWWTIVAGITVGLSVALIVLQVTPQVFEANAALSTGSQKLTGEFQVPTTVSGFASQFNDLQQTVREIATERIATEYYGLSDSDDDVVRDELLSFVSSSIRIRYMRRSGRLTAGYQSDDPRLAADAANVIAGIFVDEYRSLRSGKAGENTKILETMTEAANRELQAKNSDVLAFKRLHPGAMAAQLPMNRGRLAKLEKELADKREERAEAEQRIRAIRDEQELQEAFDLIPSVTPRHSGDPSPTAPKSSALHRQVEALRIRYADSHPDIQALLRQIKEIENTPQAEPGSAAPPERGQPPPRTEDLWSGYAQVEQRLIDRLESEERGIVAGIREVKNLIDGTGAVQQELDELSLGLEALRGTYSEARQKLELARAAEIGEENQISGEVALRGTASPPTSPISPKPLPIAGVSVAAALLLFIGPIVVRWFLFPVVASEAGIRSLAEIPILVTVPRFKTPDVAKLVRRRRVKNFGLSLLSTTILAGTVAIHWFGLGAGLG
jgi:uncharacterized protein involved in exopolysaccharide biosynthesis